MLTHQPRTKTELA